MLRSPLLPARRAADLSGGPAALARCLRPFPLEGRNVVPVTPLPSLQAGDELIAALRNYAAGSSARR